MSRTRRAATPEPGGRTAGARRAAAAARGTAPPGGRGDAAFTLFELSAVIVLLGFLMVIGVARVDFLVPATRVRAAARELGAVLQHIKNRAVSEGRPHFVTYDCPNRTYWVVVPAPVPPEELVAMGALSPDDLGAPPAGFQPFRFVESLRKTLPDGVFLSDVAIGSEVLGGLVTVEITPYGSTRTHYLHLADETRERQTTLKFNGLTGHVTFFDGYLQPVESVMEAE